MGIRMDQWIGLKNWASDFVRGEEELKYTIQGKKIYPDGTEELYIEEVRGSNIRRITNCSREVNGAFSEVAGVLNTYEFPDGSLVREYVQAEPWSSGPCYFIALEKYNSKTDTWYKIPESLWSEEEINNA